MKQPVIAVPYFPGSNGDYDAINRIEEFGMKALPLYFHIGDEKRLMENAKILENDVDGAFLPGGFPYEDRLGFGVVPSKIKPFANALRKLADKGMPVLAVCSGNQIAHAMRLAFPEGNNGNNGNNKCQDSIANNYSVAMLPNICDTAGELKYHGFLDKEIYTRLDCNPNRTAFTSFHDEETVINTIIDHGGGRFWADEKTLKYILQNGLIVTRYCNKNGNAIDEFPVNPNGSMLNIESITNIRGNVKIGMAHDERKLNALFESPGNKAFASMREFIYRGCPDLSIYAEPQEFPLQIKDFKYMSKQSDNDMPERTIDIYIKMLTDDNERTTAQLFLGTDTIDRRRLLRIELSEEYASVDNAKRVLMEIAAMDFFDGIMLKKDLPAVQYAQYATDKRCKVYAYEVTGKSEGRLIREFSEQDYIVEGLPVGYEQVSVPNPGGYVVKQMLQRNAFLKEAVTNVQTGTAWFFPDEKTKNRAIEELIG